MDGEDTMNNTTYNTSNNAIEKRISFMSLLETGLIPNLGTGYRSPLFSMIDQKQHLVIINDPLYQKKISLLDTILDPLLTVFSPFPLLWRRLDTLRKLYVESSLDPMKLKLYTEQRALVFQDIFVALSMHAKDPNFSSKNPALYEAANIISKTLYSGRTEPFQELLKDCGISVKEVTLQGIFNQDPVQMKALMSAFPSLDTTERLQKISVISDIIKKEVQKHYEIMVKEQQTHLPSQKDVSPEIPINNIERVKISHNPQTDPHVHKLQEMLILQSIFLLDKGRSPNEPELKKLLQDELEKIAEKQQRDDMVYRTNKPPENNSRESAMKALGIVLPLVVKTEYEKQLYKENPSLTSEDNHIQRSLHDRLENDKYHLLQLEKLGGETTKEREDRTLRIALAKEKGGEAWAILQIENEIEQLASKQSVQKIEAESKEPTDTRTDPQQHDIIEPAGFISFTNKDVEEYINAQQKKDQLIEASPGIEVSAPGIITHETTRNNHEMASHARVCNIVVGNNNFTAGISYVENPEDGTKTVLQTVAAIHVPGKEDVLVGGGSLGITARADTVGPTIGNTLHDTLDKVTDSLDVHEQNPMITPDNISYEIEHTAAVTFENEDLSR